MNDLISRQQAIDALVKAIREDPYYDSNEAINGLGVCDVRVILNDLPSAQPEITRCKDCKWYGRADKRRFYRGMDCLQRRIDTIVPDKDFCSRAERRTDD